MLVLYYPPFRADDDVELADQTVIALRAYVEDLAEFPQDALRNGWRDVRRAHKVERWPTIQVIRDACISCQQQGGKKIAQMNIHELRISGFRRTGAWLDSWGDRPAAQDKAESDRALERIYSESSPDEQGVYDEILRRLGNGESAGAILRETMARSLSIPLLPHERVSGSEADRRRTESIRRTGVK